MLVFIFKGTPKEVARDSFHNFLHDPVCLFQTDKGELFEEYFNFLQNYSKDQQSIEKKNINQIEQDYPIHNHLLPPPNTQGKIEALLTRLFHKSTETITLDIKSDFWRLPTYTIRVLTSFWNVDSEVFGTKSTWSRLRKLRESKYIPQKLEKMLCEILTDIALKRIQLHIKNKSEHDKFDLSIPSSEKFVSNFYNIKTFVCWAKRVSRQRNPFVEVNYSNVDKLLSIINIM